VDDEPEVLGVAVNMLQAKGYTVLHTGDPLEALRIARTETGVIHLLLSDVVMPLMNGREMAEQVRAIRPAIKVLFMSAYSTETIIAYGIRIARGQPFVMKPFRMEDLAAQVRAALDYRSPFGKRSPVRVSVSASFCAVGGVCHGVLATPREEVIQRLTWRYVMMQWLGLAIGSS